MKRIVHKQDGFTIVELLIATAILSVILTLVSVSMIGIGNLYYKQLNQARIQNSLRNAISDISENLQLSTASGVLVSNGNVNDPVYSYCVGTVRYTFVTNRKLGTDNSTDVTIADDKRKTPFVLWKDQIAVSTCYAPKNSLTTPSGIANSGSEMMPSNVRLTSFRVTGTSPYNIRMSAAYGDLDTLNLSSFDTTCKGGPGQQFCATAREQTSVAKRL